MRKTRRNTDRARRSTGFTLLELLVAMTILAIMGTALFTMFNQSTETWQRADARTRQFVAAREALDLMATELRQAIVRPRVMGNPSGGEAHGAEFHGYPDADLHAGQDYEVGKSYQDELYFVAPTQMHVEKASQDICLIGYWVNDDHELMRYCLADKKESGSDEPDWYTLSFPKTQSDVEKGSERLGINVVSLTFEYWGATDDGWEYEEPDRHEWHSAGPAAPADQQNKLPRAIRITLVVWDPTLDEGADPNDPLVRKQLKEFKTIVRLDNAE